MTSSFQQAGLGSERELDADKLAEQLGSAEELLSISTDALVPELARLNSLPALRAFLLEYRETTLAPKEFRAIRDAYQCSANNQLRELLALDQEIASKPMAEEFRGASRNVGHRQLNRLKPCKDLRVVQLYREAVNAGRAQGWHTIVFGLVLSSFSLPLRQGLLHYGQRTMSRFIESAAHGLALPESGILALQAELVLSLPAAIEQCLSTQAAFTVVPR